MGAEATKILADNHRMYEELKFLHTMTADIEAEKTSLLQQLQSATRLIIICVIIIVYFYDDNMMMISVNTYCVKYEESKLLFPSHL